MTREEAISLLTQVNKILVSSNSWLENTHEPLNMAFDMAIKALEREPFINKPCVSVGVCEHDKMQAFDKVRAEIKALSPEPTAYDVVDGNPIKDAVLETLADVLKIIDKYKAESEE